MGVFAGLLLTLCVAHFATAYVDVYNHNAVEAFPSFLATPEKIEGARNVANVVLMEFDAFHEQLLDKVGDSVISLLEQNGYDIETNPEAVLRLVSFLETQVGPKGSGFLGKLKGFLGDVKDKAKDFYGKHKESLKKAFKNVLISAIKTYMQHGTKPLFASLERINEKAITKLPVKARIVIAPILFHIWKLVFEKNHIPTPPNFSITDFICKGIKGNQCHLLLERMNNDLQHKLVKQANPTLDDLEEEAEEKIAQEQEEEEFNDEGEFDWGDILESSVSEQPIKKHKTRKSSKVV